MSYSALPSIKSYASPQRSKAPVRGLVGVTDGLKCHGCPSFEVRPTRSIIEPWRYWCEAARKPLDPFEGRCIKKEPAPPPPKRKPTESFPSWLGRRLHEERMPASALARECGVADGTVSKWLGGVKPKAASLAKVEAVLGRYEGEA